MIARMRRLIHSIAAKLAWLPPLLARVTLFAIFFPSGKGKLSDLSGPTQYFTDLGIPFPHFNAILAACVEVGGGALLLVGLLTRVVSLPLIITMIVAIITAKWPKLESGWDFFGWDEWAYIVVLLYLFVYGPGALSLDHLLGRKIARDDASAAPR